MVFFCSFLFLIFKSCCCLKILVILSFVCLREFLVFFCWSFSCDLSFVWRICFLCWVLFKSFFNLFILFKCLIFMLLIMRFFWFNLMWISFKLCSSCLCLILCLVILFFVLLFIWVEERVEFVNKVEDLMLVVFFKFLVILFFVCNVLLLLFLLVWEFLELLLFFCDILEVKNNVILVNNGKSKYKLDSCYFLNWW